MDLDLRKLRYFVAVAEELHFGRAAARLHIAQPVLSRQIRALEAELRVELFTRDRRGTELTAAGRQLLDDARPLLVASEALRRRVTAAGGAGEVFTIGFMPGITVTAAIQVLRDRHPGLQVRLLRTDWADQVAVLRDARADVSVVRLPLTGADRAGVDTVPLYDEPRVVALAAGHRLAGKESVRLADLAEDHLLQDPDAVPQWRDVAVELRAGRRPPVPVIGSIEEKLELVAGQAGIALIPASTARFYTRADVVCLPVEDLGPSGVALARLAGRDTALVREFIAAASVLRPDPSS